MTNDFQRMEYWGPISELRGKTALVRSYPNYEGAMIQLCPEKHVLAQFDDPVGLNGKRLDFNWSPFLKSHFRKEK